MKALVLILFVLAAFFGANRCYYRTHPRPARSLNSTLVIEYNNSDDLLVKLKKVRTGQKFELKCTGSMTETVATGLRCGTPEAAAAQAKFIAQSECKNAEINRELKRIQKLP